jgi:hypothetical protein
LLLSLIHWHPSVRIVAHVTAARTPTLYDVQRAHSFNEAPLMSDRVLHSTWFFAMVLVQRDDRFVLVRERKHGQRWY